MSDKDKHSYDVFISYAHDDKSFCRRIADKLLEQGLTTWFDEYNLKAGEDWENQIKNAINDSRICLLVISPNTDPSKPWVSKEWSTIQECTWRRKDMALCSVQLENADTPPFLRKWHSIRLSNPQENIQHSENLVVALVTAAPRDPPDQAVESEQLDTAKRFAKIRRILTGKTEEKSTS